MPTPLSARRGGCPLAGLALWCLLAVSGATWAQSQSQSLAVLIIDDMGNGLELGQRAVALPGKVSYSFLPHTPNTRELAELAHRHGKEVLLHLPMSNLSRAPVGPGKLSPRMSREQFDLALRDNLRSVPYARGVNNHMGSLLTQLRQPMQWLMDELRGQHLYFIDSRTSPLTVAEQVANANRVPALRRDVFLDNSLDPAKIEQQVSKWLWLAQRRGIAVAIGHPHPQTLAVLEERLPTLQQQGVHLVYASEILGPRYAENAATPTDGHSPPATTAKN